MVKLTITPAAKAAIEEFCVKERAQSGDLDGAQATKLDEFAKAEIGNPIEHHDLVNISRILVQQSREESKSAPADSGKQWRLDALLKGALVYQPSPPPKPEPTPEYKALMQRLRAQEEQRQYERMINPAPPAETFNQRFPNAGVEARSFNPALSHGYTGPDEVDEVTYADVNRQMILIINVLISIITCSVFIWIAARRWTVPQRLGLSMSGSGIVAVAEVGIYMIYIKRIKDAKQTEIKQVERKEVVETWVIDKAKPSDALDTIRFRKGKHR